MEIGLNKIIKQHFPPAHARTIQNAVSSTILSSGRIALHSFDTKEQIEVIIPASADGTPRAGTPLEINRTISLEDLVVAWRDLEEEQGLLPTSWKAAEQPRVPPGKYSLYGIA